MKHKRVIAIAIAILFLAVLFWIKNRPAEENLAQNQTGLNYKGEETLAELVIKDADSDGILDWEENLFGTDPNNKDTDADGEGDAEEVEKLRDGMAKSDDATALESENLTQTELFSREFFASVAALNQSGQLDLGTIDAFTNSLASEINKPGNYTTHSVSELKIGTTTKDSVWAYNEAMRVLYEKYPPTEKIISILQESISQEEEEIDVKKLDKLNPAISQLEYIVNSMLKLSVPSDIALLHLNLLNSLEQQKQDLKNIKLVDADTLMAIKAIGEYANTTARVAQSVNNIIITIQSKLK